MVWWHLQGSSRIHLLKLCPKLQGKVLISNAQHQVWPRLVDSLHDLGVLHQVHDIVGLSHIPLIDHVPWVPLVRSVFSQVLCPSVCVELLIR